MVSLRSLSASAFIAACVFGCSGTERDGLPDTPQAPQTAAITSGTWYEILRTGEIIGYLDTARIERVSEGRARVWFRFVYPTPMTVGSDTTRYRALEVREDVDCPQRRARELEMRFESIAGASAGSPMPDAQSGPIDTHPMNSGVFFVACRTIGHPLVRRGSSPES